MIILLKKCFWLCAKRKKKGKDKGNCTHKRYKLMMPLDGYTVNFKHSNVPPHQFLFWKWAQYKFDTPSWLWKSESNLLLVFTLYAEGSVFSMRLACRKPYDLEQWTSSFEKRKFIGLEYMNKSSIIRDPPMALLCSGLHSCIVVWTIRAMRQDN